MVGNKDLYKWKKSDLANLFVRFINDELTPLELQIELRKLHPELGEVPDM